MASTHTKSGLFRRLLDQIPTLLVAGGLVVAARWGMTHDWKLPTAGETEVKAEEVWCDTHNVPDGICVMCKPALLARGEPFGWCRAHGVHECTWCHPEIAQLDKPASVGPADLSRVRAALEFSPRPVNGSRDKLHERLIQFPTLAAYERSGVEVAPAWKLGIAETADVHGELTHDPARVAHISSRTGGVIWRVFKHLGETVAVNDLLALVEAPAVGQAKADYRQAIAMRESKVQLRARMQPGVTLEPTIAAADAAVREADIRRSSTRQTLVNLGLPVPADHYKGLDDAAVAEKLHFLGIPGREVTGLDAAATIDSLLPIRATLAGTITSRDVVAGEVVDTAKMLFEIIDHSTLWLTVGVRAEDVGRIAISRTKINFHPDGAGSEVTGVVAWISGEADHRTRTVRARANIDNRAALLRANTFGHGQVVLREDPGAIVVPAEAVHQEGGNHYIFVRDRNFLSESQPIKVFHTRTARVGARQDGGWEIIAGVLPGELVATKNSALLMAELLRGKIGEG